jgi:hypothetical protein
MNDSGGKMLLKLYQESGILFKNDPACKPNMDYVIRGILLSDRM